MNPTRTVSIPLETIVVNPTRTVSISLETIVALCRPGAAARRVCPAIPEELELVSADLDKAAGVLELTFEEVSE